jgi:hypothetical protein
MVVTSSLALGWSVQEADMQGVITGKDVLMNSVTIIRLWGPRRYLRCLRAALSRNPSTFLNIVSR